MDRPSRRDYFMAIADVVSSRATCDRARVGCVLVKEGRIIATGYNGSPPDMPHCDDVGHDMDDSHCVRTLHAEENALLQCALYGVSARGARAYVTTMPCYGCFKRLLGAGIKTVVYRDVYRSATPSDLSRIEELAGIGGVDVHRYQPSLRFKFVDSKVEEQGERS